MPDSRSTPAIDTAAIMRRHAEHLDLDGQCMGPRVPVRATGVHCETYLLAVALDETTARVADAWDEGVAVTLNHAIDNPDGLTLRLEHLDGRPWLNPHRARPADGAVVDEAVVDEAVVDEKHPGRNGS